MEGLRRLHEGNIFRWYQLRRIGPLAGNPSISLGCLNNRLAGAVAANIGENGAYENVCEYLRDLIRVIWNGWIKKDLRD